MSNLHSSSLHCVQNLITELHFWWSTAAETEFGTILFATRGQVSAIRICCPHRAPSSWSVLLSWNSSHGFFSSDRHLPWPSSSLIATLFDTGQRNQLPCGLQLISRIEFWKFVKICHNIGSGRVDHGKIGCFGWATGVTWSFLRGKGRSSCFARNHLNTSKDLHAHWSFLRFKSLDPYFMQKALISNRPALTCFHFKVFERTNQKRHVSFVVQRKLWNSFLETKSNAVRHSEEFEI